MEKKLWCELCGSKGVRHKKDCPSLDTKIEEVKVSYKTEYSVYNEDSLVRVYSEEIHGENARELAQSFANKNNYLIK